MKIVTHGRLVILAVLLPAIVLASVFMPTVDKQQSYDAERSSAGKKFTRALWDSKLASDIRDREGQQYFDDGIASYDAQQDFRAAFTERAQNCQVLAQQAYCDAAADAFTAGYRYAETVNQTVEKARLKDTQRDNWQSDIKKGTIPSYLMRKEGGQF